MEKPIIFSTSMVNAILENRKTMTRRVIHPQPNISYCTKCKKDTGSCVCEFRDDAHANKCTKIKNLQEIKLPYQPGDTLWVREKHHIGKSGAVVFPGDGILIDKWRPSIHMPRKAARIFLEVLSVRIEKLKKISEADAKAEGVGKEFLDQWVTINEKYLETPYWIYWDEESRYWCKNHIDMAVKTFKREVQEGTASTSDLDYLQEHPEEISYMCDSLEEEFPVSCETCGKPLSFWYPSFPDDLDYAEGRLGLDEIAHYRSLMHDYEEKLFKKNNIHRLLFSGRWNNINEARDYSWESNPYVYVIEFRRLK